MMRARATRSFLGPLLATFLLIPVHGHAAEGSPSCGPLPEQVRAAFQAVREDPPPAKIVRGIHYVISNEGRHYLFREALKAPGGVYVGVGTDQNYLIAGWSRPEVLVLMDFDQVVVDLHRVYRLAFLKAQTPEEFIALWQHKNAGAMRELIDEGIGDPQVRAAAKRAFHLARSAVHRRLLRVKARYQGLKIATFLDDPAQYAYLVDMFKTDRVYMLRGDLTMDRTLSDIAAASRTAGLPVRTVYLSNAERYFHYNGNFRNSMLGLPFDQHSTVLRTSHFSQGRYQYSAQSGANFHAWLRSPALRSAKEMLAYRQYKVNNGLAMMLLTPDKVPPPIVRTKRGDKLCCMEARRPADKAAEQATTTRAAEESLGLAPGSPHIF